MKKLLVTIFLLVLSLSLFSCMAEQKNDSYVAENNDGTESSMPVPLMVDSIPSGLIGAVFEEEKMYSLDALELEFEFGFDRDVLTYETFDSYEIVISNDEYTYSVLFDDGPYYREDFLYTETEAGYEYPKKENISLPKELFNKQFGSVSCYFSYTIFNDYKEEIAESSLGYKCDGEKIQFSDHEFAFYSDLWLSSMYSSEEEKTELTEELMEKYDFKYVIFPLYHSVPENSIAATRPGANAAEANVAVAFDAMFGRKNVVFYKGSYDSNFDLKSNYKNGFSFKYDGEYSIDYHMDHYNFTGFEPINPKLIDIYLWDDGIVLKIFCEDNFEKTVEIIDVKKIIDVAENDAIKEEKLSSPNIENGFNDDGWTFSAKKPGRITATAPDGQEIVVYNLIPEFLKEIGKIIFDFFAFVFG